MSRNGYVRVAVLKKQNRLELESSKWINKLVDVAKSEIIDLDGNSVGEVSLLGNQNKLNLTNIDQLRLKK